jgi:alpha-N-acetylgalactosaminidase
MGTALQGSGRDIVYSCSWPAYLGGNETAKPWAAMIASGCNSWRNWEDIDCGWQSLVQIIEHWGEYGKILATWAAPGHWHDPDVSTDDNDGDDDHCCSCLLAVPARSENCWPSATLVSEQTLTG